MTQSGDNGYGRLGGQDGGSVTPGGGRRDRFKGYLRAANELRQSYMNNYSTGWDNRDSRGGDMTGATPGAYPDGAVVHGEDEEMILFPSYARKHTRMRLNTQSDLSRQNTQDTVASMRSNSAESTSTWQQQWEEYEEKDAIVDVDVRGWIFTPHKGPMSRRQRFYFSLARQLAGLPNAGAKSPGGSPSESRSTSPSRPHLSEMLEEKAAKHEAEAISKEADKIIRQGEAEVDIASRGGYSENPGRRGSADSSLEPYKSKDSHQGLRRLAASNASGTGEVDPASIITPLQKRASWPQPADMNPTQLSTAHGHLMTRLRPFISNPAANVPISAFFYNESISRQRTIYTNASGHFAIRASLDFIPTHVRILASERLSATEDVKVVDPYGISVISDIDDTIKHTSIISGAREIFRNAFIRELSDLTIEGVEDWYTRMSKADIMFHYVSNSPWQMYPALMQYFSVAKLPAGSVHLKLYSGMLQGIFEPVAERKKSTMDRLARDFPDRQFILIGDSGEADLEVYTDFVMENPGRVLAVFIRDVTTPLNSSKGFFDSTSGSGRDSGKQGSISGASMSSANFDPRRSSANAIDDDPDLRAAIAASLRDMELQEHRNRPNLPPRKPTSPLINTTKLEEIEDLIDLRDTPPASGAASPAILRQHSDTDAQSITASNVSGLHRMQPVRPKKPAALRSNPSAPSPLAPSPSRVFSYEADPSIAAASPEKKTKPIPPKPRRPSNSIRQVNDDNNHSTADSISIRRSGASPSKPPAPAPPSQKPTPTYKDMAMNKVSAAYNKLPSAPALWSNDQSGSASTSIQARAMSTSSPGDGGRSNSSPDSKDEPPTFEKKPLKHASTFSSVASDTTSDEKASRPALPSRPITSLPAAAAQSVRNGVSSAWNAYNGTTPSETPSSTSNTTKPPSHNANLASGQTSPNLSKREALWRQRWQRAEFIMRERGVVLKSWRVGGDVEEECMRMVERAKERLDGKRRREEERGKGRGGMGEGVRRFVT